MQPRTPVFFIILCFCTSLWGQSTSADTSILFIPSGQYEVDVVNVEALNSPFLEFSPAFYQNGIVFVSSKANSGFKDETIGENFFQLYYAEILSSGLLLRPKPFSAEINSPRHEGPACFDPNGGRMFFTRNKKGVSKNGLDRLKIFSADKGLFDWEKTAPLPFNSDAYDCAHPSLSFSGRKLFFSSNMPGGYGGMDLYVTTLEEGIWSVPVNLGPTINTINNEVFPFIHHSGMLFFASDREEGLGGLDLFVTNVDAPDKRIYNLGPPFNSPFDDLGIILDYHGETGYLTSSRPGGQGKDDIYYFQCLPTLWGEQLHRSLNLSLLVTDHNTSAPIEGVKVYVFENHQGQIPNLQTPLDYEAVVLPSNGLEDQLMFRISKAPADETLPGGFQTDKYGLFEQALQKNRQYALAVIKPGYEAEEVYFTTFGAVSDTSISIALKPIACNQVNGLVFDSYTKTGIKETIIQVTSSCLERPLRLFTDEEGYFSYCLPVGCTYELHASKSGYLESQKILTASTLQGESARAIDISLQPAPSIAGDQPLVKGRVLVLNQIYYDFNKSSIRTGAAKELEELALLMLQYPEMEVELVSHTDARGTRKYNKLLSEKRSQAAKEFLTGMGVNEDRVKTKGLGEKEIRNHCVDDVDCPEEEHQFNRRTEVHILKLNQEVKIEYRLGNPGE